jgi:transposase-like protein
VSEINKGLDGMVEEYRNRPLDAEYPLVWVDGLYEKIRESRRVRYMAVIVVKGVNTKEMTQVLAVEPMENESEKTYRGYLPGCGSGALRRSGWWFSDAHAGLQAAIRKDFIGAPWQRCKVHSCTTS